MRRLNGTNMLLYFYNVVQSSRLCLIFTQAGRLSYIIQPIPYRMLIKFSFALFLIPLCFSSIGYDQAVEHVKKVRESAIAGTPESCLELGNAYYYGRGIDQDMYSAFQWYLEAAKSNNPAALFNVALCYDEGIGTEVNKIEALRWYKKAADAGVLQAKFNLAMYYKDGAKLSSDSGDIFLEKDFQKSLKLLKECSNAMFPPANRELAKMYLKGNNLKQDKNLGLKLLERSANKEDPEALYLLAKYKIETGVDVGIVFPMIKKAAKNNVTDVFELIGACYEIGKGIPRNKDMAVQYYKKAADAGILSAQLRLADYYLNGIIVNHDIWQAIYWYKKAAAQNDPYALFMLGTFADQGIGENINKQKALKYFTKSAQLGFAKAQYNIAKYYSQGIITEKESAPLAYYWYRKAALQDDSKAQKEMGFHYLTGHGVKQNYAYGLNWLNLSEKNGDTDAKSFMDEIQIN